MAKRAAGCWILKGFPVLNKFLDAPSSAAWPDGTGALGHLADGAVLHTVPGDETPSVLPGRLWNDSE